MRDLITSPEEYAAVQRAFSKQAEHYDHDDRSNPVLTDWRKQVYNHVDRFIAPGSHVLELNAGTGIDALRLANRGHFVLATDNAPGMIQKIKEKTKESGLKEKLQSMQCSFDSLAALNDKKFDYVFSNFGGLNCCKDLSRITKQLPALLNANGYVTWVIMPPISPWELLWIFRGKTSAFRRFGKGLAHVEGEYFRTYYHSLSSIKKSFGKKFKFIKAEGIGSLSPPPSSLTFIKEYPTLYRFLKNIDNSLNKYFPFNRCADHIIVTFQFNRA